jgi:hypothetical protein
MKILLLTFLILTLLGPLWMIVSGHIDFRADYRTANRASSHIAPLPSDYPEAIVQVYAARAFNWRGIFALHMWLAIKPKNANAYTTYQVVGWYAFRGLPALVIQKDLPDRLWFDQKPEIILDIRGVKAEQLIPELETAIQEYPYSDEYLTWPGPNSNTFIAYIARAVPDMQLSLPSNAVGKDFAGKKFFVKTPSGTGYQFTVFGLFGVLVAIKEGFEINILGLVYGFNPSTLSIKLPGFGDIGIFNKPL